MPIALFMVKHIGSGARQAVGTLAFSALAASIFWGGINLSHLEFIIGDRQAACKVAALRATPDLLKEGGITQYAVLPLAIAADYTSAAYQAFRCD